jgi:hypothetical protein
MRRAQLIALAPLVTLINRDLKAGGYTRLTDEQLDCLLDPTRANEARGMLDDMDARVTSLSPDTLVMAEAWISQQLACIALARRFASNLSKRLTAQQLEAVRKGNATDPRAKDGSICYSQDFCDANVYMGHAWEAVKLPAHRSNSDEHAAVWNAAWNLAKACEFRPERIHVKPDA